MTLQNTDGLTYGFLDVTDGVRHEEQPLGAAVLAAPRHAARNRAGDTLCILVELVGPRGVPYTLYRELLTAIADTYFLHPGSITAGLRAAIAEANARLLHENTGPEPRTVVYGALSCAVWHANEVIIAQVGPAAAAMVRAGRLERYPPPPVPGAAEAQRATALGQVRNIDPAFFYSPAQPDDRLCLLSGLPAEPGSEALSRSLSRPNPQDALEALAWLAGEGDVSAVLVVGGARATEDRGPRSADGRLGLRSSVLGHLSSARVAARQLLDDWLPQAKPRGERPPLAWRGRPAPTSLLLVIAIAVPALVSFIAASTYVDRQRSALFEARLLDAQAQIEQARALGGDAAAARVHWAGAWARLEEAAALRSGDPALLELRAQTQMELDRIDKVTRVRPALLRNFPSDARLARVIVQDGHVYTLDVNAGAFYHDVLNEERTELAQAPSGSLVFEGQPISALVLGEPVDVAWLPPAASLSSGVLAVLDARGTLATLAPDATEPLARALPEAESWAGQAQAIAGYQGNLYVLSAEHHQIWRYEGREATFDNPPKPYFGASQPDLSGAVDLAIAPDGAVFVVKENGELLKFFGGEVAPFGVSGLSAPLARPVALFLSQGPLAPSLYIADAGEGRIVRLSLSGVYLGQLKTDDNSFEGLSGLAVDEAINRLFFTNGRGLFVAELPPTR
jgi:hypothetical protein